jgi:ABC-type uncharacterized transport system ATPase subunit
VTDGLALRDVRKRFGRTVALDGARCMVRAGTVHALLGENGAGKTTLMRVAFGLDTPDAGEILVAGARVRFRSSQEAMAAGLGMVHQHFSLVPALTVAENVALGGTGRFDPRAAERRTREVAAATGLAVDPGALVRDLPIAAQQRAEIVKALARDARLLILDEPTAVLAPEEAQELHRWLRRFVTAGGTVVLITHRLREALEVADDVTVLRGGRTVLETTAAAADEASIVQALTGGHGMSPTPDAATRAPEDDAPVVLSLRDVAYDDERGIRRLDGVSLNVRRGEIVGVIGVEGSGERELLRLLAGRLAPTRGTVTHPDRIGFIPDDRLHDALIPGMSLAENLALAGAGAARGRIDWSAVRADASRAISAYGVQSTGPDQRAAELSGGNQQRFVIARERASAPMALVAENPARGLDIRAAAQVNAELVQAARAGAAVVLHSRDLDEVLAIATRVVACHAGRVRPVPAPPIEGDRSPYARAMAGLP